jgi:hypothetical protein
MKKEIIEVKDGVMRITTPGERWYSKQVINDKTGLPEIQFVPSVTWILDSYPKGVGFAKWLQSVGEESETIKKDAGQRGSHIHAACEMIDNGQQVTMEMAFQNEDGTASTLTPDEYEAVMSFRDWLDTNKPELLACEVTVFGSGYAGTIDRIYRIKQGVKKGLDAGIWLIDLKSSKAVYESHKLQVSAYKHANIDLKVLNITPDEWRSVRLGVLQVGYTRNGDGFKFTEVEDKFEIFKAVYQIWQNDNPNAKPLQRDFPLAIFAECRKEKK